jgi:hypothetical protein
MFIMKKEFILYILAISSVMSLRAQQTKHRITPGQIWKDESNEIINAHGGGILFYNNTYYWFGEVKKGRTWLVPGANWEDYRVDAGGISCYSSKDLLHWKYESLALASEKQDSSHDLHISRVIERPKVIYNSRTKKFVMWMHIDKADYGYAHTGVAISDRPVGPYKYLGSFRPNGEESRDMTVFQDDDGSAYLIYSSESNNTMHITQLTPDYLKTTSTFNRIFVNARREAPAMFKGGNKYYLITSLCTGWDPNMALFAVADQVLGEWKMKGNPCAGPGADSTFRAQSTFILPLKSRRNEFIFMADKWNKTNLEDSRYVWLPMKMAANKPTIEWKDSWVP